MSDAKENPRCAVHYHMFPDGLCSCSHDCDNCGVTYVGEHSKDDCITVLKRRLRLDDLAEKIKTLEANQKPMSREDLLAAAKADLLANLPAPFAQPVERCTACNQTFDAHPEPGLDCYPDATFSTRWSPPYVLVESPAAAEDTHTECNSRAGIVCGLVDGVIAIARIWNQYIDHPMPDDPAVIAAFKDMRADKDVREFFGISEFEALTADFRADFPTSKPSAPATEPDKWNDAKPCGLSGNWCFVHHCYPNTCKIMGLGEYTKPTADKCLATSKYGCVCLLDAGHEEKHDSKCGWNHNKWEDASDLSRNQSIEES